MTKISRRSFLQLFNRVLAAVGLTAISVPIVAYFFPPNLDETPSEPVLVSTLEDLPPEFREQATVETNQRPVQPIDGPPLTMA